MNFKGKYFNYYIDFNLLSWYRFKFRVIMGSLLELVKFKKNSCVLGYINWNEFLLVFLDIGFKINFKLLELFVWNRNFFSNIFS